MLHILLVTLLFLFCKAIKSANIIHLTLAILPVLAAVNIIDGSLVPFVNHLIISLTTLMMFDIADKTTLVAHQPNNTVTKAQDAYTLIMAAQTLSESWPKSSTKREARSTVNQKTHFANNNIAEDTTKRNLDKAINTIKSRLIDMSAAKTPSTPSKDIALPISDFGFGAAADRVASLKRSLSVGPPVKPVRETNPGVFLSVSIALGKVLTRDRFAVSHPCWG